MPQTPPQGARSLGDYAEFLRLLANAGFETVVIGGCAVGAYVRTIGETVISQDLDLLASRTTLNAIVAEAAQLGLQIEQLPKPRNLPVAVLRWNGMEINILTQSHGFPPADVEAQVAREFHIAENESVIVLVADPFDLLRNKLAVHRPKDEPHIIHLRRFIEEELVGNFAAAPAARERHAPIARYLDILGMTELDAALATRLIPLAKTSADFRMLAYRVPTTLGASLLARADASDKEGIQRILDKKRG